LAVALDMTTTADAPSLTPGALPAVTVPSFLNAGFNARNASIVVSRRGDSSVSNVTGSPFLPGISTGTISRRNMPASIAAIAFLWLSKAH